MRYHEIPLYNPITYHMSGKFQSLTADWKHSDLYLPDYELFVVTSGVLYLEYDAKQYRVEQGEMLLLPPVPPPCNRRRGYQSSSCSFYWLHFGLENSCNAPEIPKYNEENESHVLKIPEYRSEERRVGKEC